MAKVLVAVVAVVCAFQVMVASPAPEMTYEDALYHELGTEKWWNASSILGAIERVLGDIQQKADKISKDLEDAVKNATDATEKAALEQVKRWNATITEWVEKAEAAGVDVQECLDENNVDKLPSIGEELQQEALECALNETAIAKKAIADVWVVVNQTMTLLEDAQNVVKKCLEDENLVLTSVCYAQELPTLWVRFGRIAANGALLSARAAAKVAAIPIKTSLCVSKAAASKGQKAAVIVESTIKCIQGKLSNQ